MTLRSVIARWPEKPWLHENRNDRKGRLTAALAVFRYAVLLVRNLFPNTDEGNSRRLSLDYSTVH